jgi:hypothetical protein
MVEWTEMQFFRFGIKMGHPDELPTVTASWRAGGALSGVGAKVQKVVLNVLGHWAPDSDEVERTYAQPRDRDIVIAARAMSALGASEAKQAKLIKAAESLRVGAHLGAPAPATTRVGRTTVVPRFLLDRSF